MARFRGDNGKPDVTGLKDLLSPYESDRSALTDCAKLATSGFTCQKAVVIYGFDYPDRPLDPAIDAFEALAARQVEARSAPRGGVGPPGPSGALDGAGIRLGGNSAMSKVVVAGVTIWDIKPGDVIRRVDLHRRYGGRRQGGIGPSRRTPNVFIFSDPERGQQHGYFDDWQPDGLFHYTGEGQRGDQRMEGGNKTILEHQKDGRALRVFKGAGGDVTYAGEFELASDPPWYYTDAPETGSTDTIRQVVVFRLRPLDAAPQPAQGPTAEQPKAPVITEVPIEEQNTERAYVQPNHQPYEAERREQKLVQAYRVFMSAQGSRVVRHMMRPEAEAKPLFSDLYNATRNQLIEAKGTGTREAVRMAIGQLLDYRRFLANPQCAVLLPERPRPDLEALLEAVGVGAVWPELGGAFTDNARGAFT